MNNSEKIIALLSKNSGLDDDELSSQLGIKPRQQVNQICRRLQSAGKIHRRKGPTGKIVNYLADSELRTSGTTSKTITNTIPKHSNEKLFAELNALDLRETLIIIPCSGKKAQYSKSIRTSPSITDYLPKTLSARVSIARNNLAIESNLDNRILVPAWMRNNGTLYQTAYTALEDAVIKHRNILIISGGYGLVLATEPIGNYNKVFKYSTWPTGLLEEVLLTYLEARRLKNVIALVSASTGYRAFIDKVNWASRSLSNIFLITPEASKGAMVKTPRALGEALSLLLGGKLDSKFISSDGLGLIVKRLGSGH